MNNYPRWAVSSGSLWLILKPGRTLPVTAVLFVSSSRWRVRPGSFVTLFYPVLKCTQSV
ncbi:MAG: hypothetical protein HC804_11300 [Anaerolineae bacterium]|nr:hypothetical protein [Anaerolineae bacterium]